VHVIMWTFPEGEVYLQIHSFRVAGSRLFVVPG